MTPIQTIELRQSTIKQRLSELTSMESPETEQRSEMETLTAEYQTNELRWRGMKVTEGDRITTRTADNKLQELEERASLGEIFDNVRRNRQATGATKEYQDELGMDSNFVPLAMIAPRQRLEERAAATITGDTQGNQEPTVRAVFPGSVSAFLNIDQPTVPVGQLLIPVISTSASVHSPAEGAAAAESTGVFTVTTLTASRLQASFRWQREDAAKFQELESSLRDNLNEAVMSALDSANLNHTADGLLGTNGLTARTGDASAVATFADHYAFLFDSATVDGSFASMSSDVRILYGPAGYNHAASVYRGNSSDMTALSAIMRDSGGVMTSSHVPDPVSNDQAVIVRKGMRRDFSNPLWNGLEIVYDDITGASTGELVIWAYLMAARKLLRADGFQRRVVQVA